MCTIFHILPGCMVFPEHLENAAANNWHSWGLIIKKPDQPLEVIKKVPENSGLPLNNPECGGVWKDLPEIKKLLEDNQKYERFLHFRYSTAGDIDDDNCHPHLCYEDDGDEENPARQVYLMHNGMFHGLGNKASAFQPIRQGMTTNWNAQDVKKISDTKDFCDNYLIPPLREFVEGNYQNSVFQKFVFNPLYRDKGCNSRILMIANDIEPLKMGQWDSFRDPDTKEEIYHVSTSEYLDKVKRGPLFIQAEIAERARREQEAKANQAAAAKSSSTGTAVTAGRGAAGGNGRGDINVYLTEFVRGAFQTDPIVTKGLHAVLTNILGDLDSYELELLFKVTQDEFETVYYQLAKDNAIDVIAAFTQILLENIHGKVDEIESLEGKLDRATKRIATLEKKLKATALTVIEGGKDQEGKIDVA